MNTIIGLRESIEKSLKTENYYAALAVALALPDICGKLEFPQKGSGERFKDWFNKYLQSKYQLTTGETQYTTLNATDCYALRCSFLHEASDDITSQHAREVLSKIKFTTMNMHNIKIEDVLSLNVNNFCQDISEGVKSWLEDIDENKEIKDRIDKLITIEISGFRPTPNTYVGNSIEQYLSDREQFSKDLNK